MGTEETQGAASVPENPSMMLCRTLGAARPRFVAPAVRGMCARPKIEYPAARAVVRCPAPTFTAPAVVGNDIKELSLEDYRGKYTVLLWYPKDFTYVCPTELIAFSDRHAEFEAINSQVVAISTDTEESHLAWTRMPRNVGGLGNMSIPIVADTTKEIAVDYGVLINNEGDGDNGIALRASFIISPDGTLVQATVNDLPIGRSVDETLRLIQAFKFNDEHGEVCPANWKPGEATMKDNPHDSHDYFSSQWSEVASPLSPGSKVETVATASDFESKVQDQPLTVVQFGASWCGKCKMLAPHMEALADEYDGSVKFLYVDIETEGMADVVDAANVPTTRLYAK